MEVLEREGLEKKGLKREGVKEFYNFTLFKP
jgi:hypothetical protein